MPDTEIFDDYLLGFFPPPQKYGNGFHEPGTMLSFRNMIALREQARLVFHLESCSQLQYHVKSAIFVVQDTVDATLSTHSLVGLAHVF